MIEKVKANPRPAIVAGAVALTTVVAAVVAVTPGTTPVTSIVSGGIYLETFDGAPLHPQPFIDGTGGWDVTADIDTRQAGTYAQQAHHGPDCQAPLTGSGPSAGAYTATNSHPLVVDADAVFNCGNHLMTATGLVGFGDLLLSPPALLDFSAGPARLEFDMSTFRTGSREWINFTLMPESQYVKGQTPTNEGGHNPRDAIHIFMGGVFGGTDVFLSCQRVNGTNNPGPNGGCDPDRFIGGNNYTTWDAVQSENGVAPSASRRDHFVFELSPTHLKVCITGNNTGQIYSYHGFPAGTGFCWTDNNLPVSLGSVWQGHAALVIDHASYNVEKSCSVGEDQFNIVHNADGDANCPPNTWHFDNFRMAPAVVKGGIPAPTTTPTGVPTSTSTPSSSLSPSPSVSSSPSSSPSPSSSLTPSPTPSGATTITFDALANNHGVSGCCQYLNGTYAGVDWGTNVWLLSDAWGAFTTRNVSGPPQSTQTNATLTLPANTHLVSVQAYNGGSGTVTISLSCGGVTVTQVVPRLVVTTVATNWTAPCAAVTIGSSNGWNTNIDNVVYSP